MGTARKNSVFGFLTEKRETYRRSAADERKTMKRAAAAQREDDRRADRELRKQELEEKKRNRRTPLDSFMGVRRWKLGTGEYMTSIDNSRFDSSKDANDFIRSVKTNPTDRAQRYAAHHPDNVPPDPKRCLCCGAATEEIHHIDGDESDSTRQNLAWCCRSCNVTIANVMRKAGIGRLTHQYNPAGGARNLGQWMNAVMSMKGEGGDMAVSDAVAMIRATSPAKRSSFAHEIWGKRGARGRGNPSLPNPEDAAADLSEAWHGRRDDAVTDVVEQVKFHGVLTGLGRLQSVSILIGSTKFKPVKFDKNTLLSSNEKGEQLYIMGGDQSLDLADLGITGHAAEKDVITLGKCFSVVYCTSKHHLNEEDRQYGAYEHILLSEEETSEVKKTGRVTPEMAKNLPDLVYDNLNQRIGFSGGVYHIDRDLDFGKYSRGLKD